MHEVTTSAMIIPNSTTRTVSPYFDEELTLIHRSFKQKENEWNKLKIKMEQKIEFLEIQLKEINEREANLKNLNNSIMTAFNDLSKDVPTPIKKIPKEIEILNDQHSREIFEIKRKYEKTLKDLEQERDEYKKSLFLTLDEKGRLEKDLKHISEKNIEYEQRFMKWDESIFLREKSIKETIDTENGVKLKDVRNEMNKLKEIHMKEKDHLEQTCQKNIESIKNSFDQEKKLLMGKMDALKEEIGILNRNNCKNNSIYEELKGKMGEEVFGIRRQKEELSQKLDNFMNSNQQLKIQIKENELNFENRLKVIREEKILAQEEIKRLKQNISDSQNKIKKIEHSEKTLRTLLNEKEGYIDEEKNELKKKLFNEKKRNEQMMDFANKLKEEYNKKHAIIVQEILNKEEEIKKLKDKMAKMSNSSRRLDKSQEKSPFRTSCYHQQCTAKGNNITENFFENNSKPIEDNKHFCSCNEQSRIEHPNVSNNLMKSLYNPQNNENSQKSPKGEEIELNNQNKSAIIFEKNYDLPLKRDNFDLSVKSNFELSHVKSPMNVNTSIINANPLSNPIKKCNSHTLKPEKNQKDYSKKLTSLLNKENETKKKSKKLTITDTNKSLLIEPNYDYLSIKSKDISTTKSKIPSKSPKISKKPEFFKRNRSVSKQEKNVCSTNNLTKPNDLDIMTANTNTIKTLTPTNNHLTINNMIGVLNLPSSIECSICKKIVNVAEFVEHLNQCAGGAYGDPPSELHNPHTVTVFSDISNIQHNLSFNTSSEIPEIEKKTKHNTVTIHESIPNERALNRKYDENFFSLAPGILMDSEIGNLIKNESNRYAESPSAINMTNEFSTSHKKGIVQDSLINSSFVIRSMNEIKRNSKK